MRFFNVMLAALLLCLLLPCCALGESADVSVLSPWR